MPMNSIVGLKQDQVILRLRSGGIGLPDGECRDSHLPRASARRPELHSAATMSAEGFGHDRDRFPGKEFPNEIAIAQADVGA